MRGAMLARALRSPAFATWLPVALLAPVMVLDAARQGTGVTALGVVGAVVGCLPLVLRGRVPFVVLAPLLSAGIVVVLWTLDVGDTVVLIPIVALIDLAERGTPRRSAWIALAVLPCVIASVLPFADDAGDLVTIVARNYAFCLLALAGGDILRARREEERQRSAARLGEERLRMAQEVHDVVAHAMVAINVQAGVAAHLLNPDPQQARSALREIKAARGGALTQPRPTPRGVRGPEGGGHTCSTATPSRRAPRCARSRPPGGRRSPSCARRSACYASRRARRRWPPRTRWEISTSWPPGYAPSASTWSCAWVSFRASPP